jgi:serine/threonine protein phosphatase 1
MDTRYYIIGDIHGQLKKLKKLVLLIRKDLSDEDILIFLGDYIDRGPSSYEVIEYLLKLSSEIKTIFLKGNHEDMFLRFVTVGDNNENFIRNGGEYTIRSYRKNLDDFILPESHIVFFNSLKLYYEGEDFIAVHAGLNPDIQNLGEQKKLDLTWIREEFYKSPVQWKKTVIFGHTPTLYIHGNESVYIDTRRNIIGIDTNAMSEGFPLSCIRWPDRKIYQAYK